MRKFTFQFLAGLSTIALVYILGATAKDYKETCELEAIQHSELKAKVITIKDDHQNEKIKISDSCNTAINDLKEKLDEKTEHISKLLEEKAGSYQKYAVLMETSNSAELTKKELYLKNTELENTISELRQQYEDLRSRNSLEIEQLRTGTWGEYTLFKLLRRIKFYTVKIK